jgi:hypothetical protein
MPARWFIPQVFVAGNQGGFRLADKSSRLIRDALSRAAAEPEGLALVAGKSATGLFPATSAARAAAERCKDEGYLRVVRKEAKGKLISEICVLTDKGRQFLGRESNPREVLEDFVRVLEGRQADVGAVADSVRKMQQGLQGILAAVAQVLPRLAESPAERNGSVHRNDQVAATPVDALAAEVKARLAEWHAAAGASEDCPLPELYRRLEAAGAPSIGQYHDCLRQLHDERLIYLHPWTGPLYALPEPAFALLVGHEIAYYASIR